MRMNDGVIKLIGRNLARLGPAADNDHVADQHQAVNVGIERTDAIGQRFRQHGDDPARKLHAGAAVEGVFIDGVAGLDVVRDVGDGHQQAPARTPPFFGTKVNRGAKDRIVKVATSPL